MKKLITVLLIVTICFSPLFADTDSPSGGSTEPEPIDYDNIPPWAMMLFRFESIFVGSFPIVYFLSVACYDIYAMSNDQSSGMISSDDTSYLSEEDQEQLAQDRNILLTVSVGSAVLVALVDLIIGFFTMEDEYYGYE